MKVNQVKCQFLRRGETGVPGENLSMQSREPTNSTQILRRVWESNPGHTGGPEASALTTAPSIRALVTEAVSVGHCQVELGD